jgi:hypothetical protein
MDIELPLRAFQAQVNILQKVAQSIAYSLAEPTRRPNQFGPWLSLLQSHRSSFLLVESGPSGARAECVD